MSIRPHSTHSLRNECGFERSNRLSASSQRLDACLRPDAVQKLMLAVLKSKNMADRLFSKRCLKLSERQSVSLLEVIQKGTC